MSQPVNDSDQDNQQLTLPQAQAILSQEYQKSYSLPGLRKACDEGRLRATLEGQGNRATWYTTLADLKEFVETNRGPGRPPTRERKAAMTSQSRPAITLSLNNQKGGVGKTTSATTLACLYAAYGLKVLLVDNDPQANAGLQFGVGLENNRPAQTMYEVYLGQAKMPEVVVPTVVENVSLAPSSIELSEVEQRLTTMNGADRRLDKALSAIRDQFDLIIIDSPPNLGKLVVNSLVACDYFLIPIEGSDALRAIKSILNLVSENATYNDKNAELAGIFITMMYKSNVMTSLREAAQSLYGEYCLQSEVRRSNLVKEATATTRPLPLYAPGSEIVEDYRQLALEIAERVGLEMTPPVTANQSRSRR